MTSSAHTETSKYLLLDNDVGDFVPIYLLNFDKGEINMLFEKIISLGYILQMVVDIYRVSNHGTIFIVAQCNVHPAMLVWQRSVCWQRSSEVIPHPWAHIVWRGLVFEDNQQLLSTVATQFELQAMVVWPPTERGV